MPQIERRSEPFSLENAPKTQEMARTAEEARRAIKDRLNPYKSEVIVQVNPRKDFPFRTVHVGDTHWGHDASIIGALDEAIKEVGEDGIMITQGNIIEGLSNKFTSTNTTKTGFNLDEQEMIVRDKLRPLGKKRHLIAVGGNTCHEGWAVKMATHDPLPNMVDAETPMLFTGGQVKFMDGDKLLGSVELYHNAGKGRTNQSPEGSIRERYREIPVGHPDSPTAIADAHMHQNFGGQDIFHNPVTRTDIVKTFGEVGAAKGTKENLDEFLSGLGVAARNMPGDAGQGLEFIWEKKGPYPVVGYDRANLLFGAKTLWENSQRTGNFEELREMILEKEKPSSAKLRENESDKRKREAALKAEGTAPLYKTLSYDIKTSLPVRIQFMGNLRVGSSTFEQNRVISILDKAEANPWAYIFATRRLVDEFTAKHPNRDAVLEKLAKLLGHAKGSLLGIMLTDELRKPRWTRPVREGKKVKSDSIYPGDWLYNESVVKGTPLFLPENVSFLKVGGVDYTLYQKDKLSHFTSLINPEHGLKRVQEVFGILADAYVGGHTEVVGWRTWMKPWGQVEIVIPGGFSEYIEKGHSNRVDYPEGGQGIILFPNKKTVFSFGTHNDGVDIHDALWLQEGLRSMGKLEEVSKKLEKVRE